MPERLFVFIQMEFPWALGPQDGRYLLRAGAEAEAERVVVLGTFGAERTPLGRHTSGAHQRSSSIRELWGSRGAGRQASPEPAAVPTARVTVIDPVSLSAESQARAWLTDLDRERDVWAAIAILNRVLHSHRLAAADPYVHEVSATQALVIRAGWGEGEQVADGRWLHARELPWSAHDRRSAGSRRRRVVKDRSAALRPQERLAAVLGGREKTLLCEELTLRARLDLEQDRLRLAAVELDGAYTVALPELHEEDRQDLAIRVAELEQLRAGVSEQAKTALGEPAKEPDHEVLDHALGRLEAALRARTATGFNR